MNFQYFYSFFIPLSSNFMMKTTNDHFASKSSYLSPKLRRVLILLTGLRSFEKKQNNEKSGKSWEKNSMMLYNDDICCSGYYKQKK